MAAVESIDRSTSKAPSAAAHPTDGMEAVRETPEYKAAWDLELWRLLQQRRIDRDLREQQKKAIEQMKANIALKDKEAQSIIERKIREVSDELKKVTTEAASQEQRRHRLLEAEKEMKRQQRELAEQRKRWETEVDDRCQRLKEEFTHRLALEQEKQKNLESTIRSHEERLASSQKEYLHLWEEFANFKTKILKEGGSGILGTQMDTLRAQHAGELVSLTERHEKAVTEISLQFERKVEALHQENKKLSSSLTQKKEHIKVLQSEVNLQKEKVRDLSREVDQLRQQVARNIEPKPATVDPACNSLKKSVERVASAVETDSSHSIGNPAVRSVTQAEKELRGCIDRWQREKSRLLEASGGAYTENSEVIQDLTRRIVKAQEQLRRVSE